MNNIYKVIWSKAKNCYVVASEIARSHTKSATGSEKIGGVTRRSLLASLMALSLLCGGLGVASAADSTVHVDASTTPGNATEVYTTTGVNTLLADYGKKSDVENNKNSITTMNTTITTQGQSIATNVANIANNTKAIEKKIDTEAADLKYATKEALADKADQTTVTALDGRVGDVEGKVAALETKVGDASSGLVKDVADLNTELGKKADQTDLGAANQKITDLQKKTEKLSADGTELKGMTTVSGTNVEADVLTVKKKISNGAGVNTTLTAIDASMKQTDTNKTDITTLKTKTTEISYADGDGTRISGVTIKNGNIVGDGNSAITQLANVETDKIETDSINGKSLTGTTVATETEVKDVADAVKTETDERKAADTALEEKITKNSENIATLDGKVATAEGNITDLKKKDTELEGRIKTNEGDIETNKNAISDINKRTGGIARNLEDTQTTIEGSVKVDNKGNVKEVNELSAKKITTTEDADLKGDVTLGTPNGTNTVTVNGTANFHEAVNMDKGLNVTNGETNLGNTTVTGDLKVTGTITTDKMVFGDPTTNNYTEIDHGKVTSTNLEVRAGQAISSSSTFDVEKNEVGFGNGITGEQSSHKQTSDVITDTVKNNNTGDQSFHKQTSDVIMDNVKDGKNSNNRTQTKTETKDIITDEKGNSSTTSQTASENKTYLKDENGKNTNSTIDTAKGYDKTIKGEKGKTSTTQDELNITNTAKDGTITNDAKNIVNNAATMDTTVTGKATESYGVLETTVTGQATQNFNGGLNTTVTGAENHTVTGTQTNTVGGGQINNITGGQTNNILTGDQKTTVSGGSIINKAEHGDISNTAKNVTNEGTESVTNTVGANEVKVSQDGVDIKAEAGKKITESVGTASRVVENDKIADNAGGSTVTTEKDKGTTFGKAGSTDTTNIYGDSIKTGTINARETTTDKLTAGAAAGANGGRLTVDANDGVKGSYKSGDYTSKSYILPNTLKSGVDNGKEPIDADFVGSRTDHYMDGDKAKLDETVKDADGSNVTKKTSTDTATTITDGITTTKTEQGTKDITNTATAGTITNDAKVITNKASEVINNEAININNTATGTITSKASEIKNEADKLISNKVGENTWENMEDGKITTSIKNGTKQNLTQSDAEKTEHSVVNGSNSTVNKQTSEEITDAVTNGTTTNVTQNTATSSNNTIADTNGNANTVVSTVNGTKFTNTGANTAIREGTVTDTTIKGNTITTGKVTMDYADVMKDLGVKGNTTLGEVGKDTTLTVNSKATFNNGLTVTNGETKLKNTTIEGTLNVFENATFKNDVTAKSFSVNGKTYIDSDGLNANNQVIRNVADGSISEGSKDAVNGGQLYTVKNDLEGKVNKVGANAAAMANLHPMEFDPDSKWNIAAAIGNYGSETAAALGAFYRPNDDVMVNLSTAFGTGENMVGGGVSVRLGKGGNKLSREESNALKDQVNDLTARMDALLSVLNPNMSKDFPDVPENHWAYEAVSRLAGNDIVQGYPDGEFHGERTMTRYEMAEIIYNALSRGAEAEKELVEEFKPELQAMAASEKATAERAEG